MTMTFISLSPFFLGASARVFIEATNEPSRDRQRRPGFFQNLSLDGFPLDAPLQLSALPGSVSPLMGMRSLAAPPGRRSERGGAAGQLPFFLEFSTMTNLSPLRSVALLTALFHLACAGGDDGSSND